MTVDSFIAKMEAYYTPYPAFVKKLLSRYLAKMGPHTLMRLFEEVLKHFPRTLRQAPDIAVLEENRGKFVPQSLDRAPVAAQIEDTTEMVPITGFLAELDQKMQQKRHEEDNHG